MALPSQGIGREAVDPATVDAIDVAALESASTTKKSATSRPEVGCVHARIQPVKHCRIEQEVGKSAVSEKH